MLPFLTKSMRLMRHSCGSSCIWKNIWRMLEMLMQARTALGQRTGTNHSNILEYSHPSQAHPHFLCSLPWADSRRKVPATAALTGQLCRRRGLPARGKDQWKQKGNLTHPPVRGGPPAHLASSSKVSLLPNPLPHRYSSLLSVIVCHSHLPFPFPQLNASFTSLP